MILWLDLLSIYRWPGEETNYTDAPAHAESVKAQAPFEVVSELYETIRRRLARTGADGITLRHELANGLTVRQISPAARDALNYCCGREKTRPFVQWLADRRYKGDRFITTKEAKRA